MRPRTVNVLLIEDHPAHARMIREAVREARGVAFRVQCVDRLSSAIETLSQGDTDVVLLDLSLPDSEGLETLRRARAAAPDVPFLVLTGLDDEALGVDAVHAGAQDYLVKGQVGGHLLIRAMRYAIERARTM